MAASANDLLTSVGTPGTATTLAAPGYTIGDTAITVASTTNWTTGTGVIFAIDTFSLVSGVETQNVGSYCVFQGTVVSSTSITNVSKLYGTAQNYTAGSTTRVYITISSLWVSRLVSWGTAQHSQLDGSHTAITATSVSNSGSTTLTGPLTIKSYDGWITSPDTWVYASATTFTIAGVDRTAQFPVGTKIKLTQTTAKYFYVTASSFSTNTTVTITGGTDYTLANAAITLPNYSYMVTPQAFPQGFAYTPAYTNITVGNGTTTARFSMIGKQIFAKGVFTLGTTSSITGGVGIPYPVTANSSGMQISGSIIGGGVATDAGIFAYPLDAVYLSTTAMNLNARITVTGANPVYSDVNTNRILSGTVPISFGNTDSFTWQITYEAA